MNKRILAWLLLAGFALLVANIAFVGFYRAESFVIYLIIVVFFLFTQRNKKQ